MEDLAAQEVKLTICFYENPAAKQEIKFWESLVEDKISSKSFVDDRWSYHLEENNEHELVVCIPLKDVENFRGIYNISTIANDKFDLHRIPGKLRYHKTLIFGKVEVEQLKYITVMMDLMSRGKWR